MPTVHIMIKGKVQGVFFRASAKEKASALGVKGWVKNTREGDVESVASGNEKQLEAFIEWCRQGPSKAKVTSLEVTPINDQSFEGFQIER